MITALENNNNSNTDVIALSDKETKQYLTPFAFKMDESLFGLPLASPTKRGIALLIDLSLIALLSDVSGVFLAFTIAVTLYYLGNKKRAQKLGKNRGNKRRAIMRFISSIILFIILLNTLPVILQFISGDNVESQVKSQTANEDKYVKLAQSLTVGAVTISTLQTIADSNCDKVGCWQKELAPFTLNLAAISDETEVITSKNQRTDLFKTLVEDIKLTDQEKEQLVAAMHDSYNQSALNFKQAEIAISLSEDAELTDVDALAQPKVEQPAYSIIAWVKGIIEDLGLGFGWATFYFTAFIALWQGQTIGKKLLNIRVLQLDGTPLTIWDSFGRYGGYGAGLATGLLGFLQIYWNPNKQAIHDQISSTVVIDLNKARLSQDDKIS